MGDLVLAKQGAEARVYRTVFLGRQAIVKERFQKNYRHPVLDKALTSRRTNQEVRSILRCRKAGVACPAVFFLDQENHRIFMEEVSDSEVVKDFILRVSSSGNTAAVMRIASLVGEAIAKIHDADVIHGDLTTSNMLLREARNEGNSTVEQLFLIDFGLSSLSASAEDKGVDLYVLERAFLSTHPNSETIFAEILRTYKENSIGAAAAIAKLDEVRLRGRKRSMVG